MDTTGQCWVIGNENFRPRPLKDLHPLLFPPVLNKIFGHLSLWNFKKCRLVCKTWEEELRPLFRLNCKVNLTKLVTSIAEQEDASGTLTDLPESKSLILSGISKICTSYVIEEDPIIIKILMEQTLPLQIKYLELKHFQWNLSQIQNHLLKQLPSLEELRLPIQCSDISNGHTTTQNSIFNNKSPKIKNPYISRSSKSPDMPPKSISISNSTSTQRLSDSEIFLKLKSLIITLTIKDLQFFDRKNTSIQPILKLIQITPNLEEIYYPNIVQFTSPFDNPARVLLESIAYNPTTSFNRLSTLKIDTFISNRDLKVLSARGFPFKSLQITLTPDINCKHLYEFLEGVENSLKSLTLTFRDGFRLSSKFPIMSGLDQMIIILWNGYLDYIQDILKLKTLIVVLMEMEMEMVESSICNKNNYNYYNNYEEFGRKSKIEEVEIHAIRSSKMDVVQKLIKISPRSCLTKLTLDCVNDTLLQSIYLTLPYLEEFVILYGGFGNCGITGIPENFCREEYCNKEMVAFGLKRYPGIGDLKYLRNLVLTGELTDFQIILGVGQCRKLKRLELINKSSTKVTDKSVKKIADVMNQIDFLKLRNFSEISEQAVTYLITQLGGREIHIS